ncbi:MAG: hypothetical protein Q8P34_09230, partial [Bacteroidota bacterium]|nr:hypothetical protein [Bacteroidota bacterium]
TTWQVKLVGKKILSAATALPFNHPNYESKLNYSIPRIAVFFTAHTNFLFKYHFRMRLFLCFIRLPLVPFHFTRGYSN